VGRKATVTNTITEADVAAFAKVSGDHNPIHLDVSYAAKTRFKQRVAHGMLSAGFISAALVKLPDPHVAVVFLSQNIRFRRPVFLGDTIATTVEVTAVDQERRRATVSTICTNQSGEQVVVGEAEILLDAYPFAG
jgi:3-hydroxybutyryl-CoA dehydratase